MGIMTDDSNYRARLYAERHNLRLAERLGFGIHGIVHVVESNAKPGRTAIKVHRERVPFDRECAVYQRLQHARLNRVLGFQVPELLRIEQDLCVLELTIVVRPFLLDFAATHLDAKPPFPAEIWAEWEAEKREQFGEQWPTVEAVIDALADLKIFMLDVSPSNIAFGVDRQGQ